LRAGGVGNVRAFGAAGDGVTDDTAAIQAAIDSGVTALHFPGGTYNLGTLGGSVVVFDIANRSGIRFVANGAVTFTCAFAADDTRPIIFRFAGCSGFRFEGNFSFTDSIGYDADAYGVKAFVFGDTNQDFEFESVAFSGLLSGVEVAGTADSRSVTNIRANIKATNVYYVLNCQQNGDDIDADIHATNCRREYFVYGVRNHRIRLTIVNKHIGNASLITSYEGFVNKTEDITIDMTNVWAADPKRDTLGIMHQTLTGSGVTPGIENISVKYSIHAAQSTDSATLSPVYLSAYINGGAELTTGVNSRTTFLKLDGTTNGRYRWDLHAGYALTSGLGKGVAYWPNTARLSGAALNVMHRSNTFSFTPTLGGTGWALGDGTSVGQYTINNDGDSIYVWGRIVFGSTSTYGAGAPPSIRLPSLPFKWAGEGSFNLGHPNSQTMVGMAGLFDSSAGNTNGYFVVPVKTATAGGSGAVDLTLHGLSGDPGGPVLAGRPFAWGEGDQIDWFANLVRNGTASVAP